MSDHFRQIYTTQAARYDRMVAREDYRGNLLRTLSAIRPLTGLEVVEFGAGSGRLTRLLAPLVKSIHAFDVSQAMLLVAESTLRLSETRNWTLTVGDNRALPIGDDVADVALEGWSFGHLVGWYPESWRSELGKALAEMCRVLRPGGTAVLMETMGTGFTRPAPPPDLVPFYRWLEAAHGFAFRNIRTDYRFASRAELDALTRFFFGDALIDSAEIVTRDDGSVILPENTGVWWRSFN